MLPLHLTYWRMLRTINNMQPEHDLRAAVDALEAHATPQDLPIDRVQADDRKAVADYYGFEVEHGFSSVHPQDTMDNMVNFRQTQIRDGKLAVAMIRQDGKVIATTVVVLKAGAMGKNINSTEAYAAGTLVDPSLRGQGIGEQLSATQDTIAREAGKESIITLVKNDNLPSLRLRLKTGYRLEGIVQQDDGEIDFQLRKKLVNRPSVKKNLRAEWEAGRLPIVTDTVTTTAAEQIAVDPSNTLLVEQALAQGYKGVYLLRPGDLPEVEGQPNLLVFVKAENLSDS